MARSSLFEDVHAAALVAATPVSHPVVARAGQPTDEPLYVVTVDGRSFTFDNPIDADAFIAVARGRMFPDVRGYVVTRASVTSLNEALSSL